MIQNYEDRKMDLLHEFLDDSYKSLQSDGCPLLCSPIKLNSHVGDDDKFRKNMVSSL